MVVLWIDSTRLVIECGGADVIERDNENEDIENDADISSDFSLKQIFKAVCVCMFCIGCRCFLRTGGGPPGVLFYKRFFYFLFYIIYFFKSFF